MDMKSLMIVSEWVKWLNLFSTNITGWSRQWNVLVFLSQHKITQREQCAENNSHHNMRFKMRTTKFCFVFRLTHVVSKHCPGKNSHPDFNISLAVLLLWSKICHWWQLCGGWIFWEHFCSHKSTPWSLVAGGSSHALQHWKSCHHSKKKLQCVCIHLSEIWTNCHFEVEAD